MGKYSLPKPENIEIDLALLAKVLKLESLHYGLWNKGEKLTFKNLQKAQKQYSKHLIKFIPKDVKNILDVGCGIGDIAILLSKRGFNVTCISPDPLSQEYFKKIVDPKISFHLSKFEDFNSKSKFDCILMSESSNYFGVDIGFKQCKELLKPNSFVLVGGLFCKRHSRCYQTMHNKNQYLKIAKKYGFKILKREDITEKVIPTLELGQHFYREYAIPSVEILHDYYTKAFGLKYKIITLIFRKELKMLSEFMYKILPERFNPKLFKRHTRYLIFLFQNDSI